MNKSLTISLISATLILLIVGTAFFLMTPEKSIVDEEKNVVIAPSENQGASEEELIREEIRINESEKMCEAIKQMKFELCSNFEVIGKKNSSYIEDECKNAIYLKKMAFERINYCDNIIIIDEVESKESCTSSFNKIIDPELASDGFDKIFHEALNKKDPSACNKLLDLNMTQDAEYCKNILDPNHRCR